MIDQLSLMNIDTKILSKILAKKIQQNTSKPNTGILRQIKHHDQFRIIQEC